MSNGGANSTRSSSTSSTFHFAAGLTSGILSAILLQPADLLKTRLQQSHATTLLSTIRLISSGPSPIRQFWRGTLPSTLRTGLGSALYFSSLNALRTRLAAFDNGIYTSAHNKGTKSGLSASGNLVCGAVARTWAGVVMSPVTVLKVRFESSVYEATYTSLPKAAAHILRTEGVRGFFAGYGATAVRDAPYAGLYVLFYEAGKKRLRGLVEGVPGGSTAGVNFAAALGAAVAATALTNPFDAVKTRVQLFPARYANSLAALRRMWAEEGARSLFDGLGLRIARKGMSSALAWTVYEEIIRRAEVAFVEKRERDEELYGK